VSDTEQIDVAAARKLADLLDEAYPRKYKNNAMLGTTVDTIRALAAALEQAQHKLSLYRGCSQALLESSGEIAQLREALAFAKSMILSGEAMTPGAADIFRRALTGKDGE
jgi:hypothetical protein